MSRTPSQTLLGRVATAARDHLPDHAVRLLREGGRAVREATGAHPHGTPRPAGPPGAAGVVGTVRRGIAGSTVVVMTAADTLVVSHGLGPAVRVRRRLRPLEEPRGAAGGDESSTRSLDAAVDSREPETVSGRVLLDVPDPASLVRLASSGLLTGSVDSVAVTVRWAPPWLRAGAVGIRPDLFTTTASLRTRGSGVEVVLAWSRPTPIAAGLDAVLRAVLRTRTTARHDGPLPALDRTGWTAGAWTWPDGVLLDERPAAASPGPGPLAPFTEPLDALPPLGRPEPPTLVTAVAFPWRRKLLGDPVRYALRRPAAGAGAGPGSGAGTAGAAGSTVRGSTVPGSTVPGSTAAGAARTPGPLTVTGARAVASFDGRAAVERVVAGPDLVKYSTLTVGDDAALTAHDDPALLALAAVGVVCIPSGEAARSRLRGLGVPFPDRIEEVRGVEGYAWSVAVARAAGIAADPLLRRHLAPGAAGTASPRSASSPGSVGSAGDTGRPDPSGDGARFALPTVSVLIASMRPDTVPAVLADLGAQTWPDFEVLLGTHGWQHSTADLERWSTELGHPLRAFAVAAQTPFGQVLGMLSRTADGDLLTKIDDDDVYGPDHLTDLVLALRSSGADLVSKAPRFVHLAADGSDPRAGDTGSTVDRSWAASEVLDKTPAGGTLMFARSTLLDAGGWSGSLRHVDIDVTARIRRAGGVTFRSHGLGYIYVRHDGGHTWEADRSVFLEQAGDVYDGLPAALATGRPAALRAPARAPDGTGAGHW